AVGEALIVPLRVGAGVEHGVDRVGASAPPLLRPIHVEGQRQGHGSARTHKLCGRTPLVIVDEVQRPQHIVLAPTSPVAMGVCASGDLALGVLPVDRGRVVGRQCFCQHVLVRLALVRPVLVRCVLTRHLCASSPLLCVSDPSLVHWTTWVPTPAMVPSSTSPSRRKRFQYWPLPAGLPVSSRSPGSSRAVWLAADRSAARSNMRSAVLASCLISPLRDSWRWV